jgi:Flp pilus assembly pilin Flp
MFFDLVARLIDRVRREEGQALVEYGLILTLVSIVSVGALAILGGKVSTLLSDVAGAL